MSQTMQALFNKIVFGTDPKKLVRRNDPDTSQTSAHKVDSAGLEKMVYETIKSFGAKGCISDEILAIHNNLPYSSVTARYRALLDKKLIVDTGERRAGKSGKPQRILKINEVNNGID